MKKLISFLLIIFVVTVSAQHKKRIKVVPNQKIMLSKSALQDKIKGGWAGKTIGVTFGGPVEFNYLGTMVDDYLPIPWSEHYIKHWFDTAPGLYDDLYMNLSFVEVIEKNGVEAPIDSFANSFANAKYPLWHANQAGRYNILNGIKAPMSGNWINNPHADDIDFQIEADFAGLMCPGMQQVAANLCNKVGHIMNYGDGYYGGLYISSLYTQSFVSDDINFIVTEALKSIPTQSTFYQCIHDVILWHSKYPTDWKRTWFEVQRKWTKDIGCPEGVFKPFDISARVNSAYVIIGLLYGNGNFKNTMDIATRCGQDADCNPSTAAGILGTIIGYNKIPEYWKKSLYEVEDRNFVYTDISLNKIYAIGYKHALAMIKANGGDVFKDSVRIVYQKTIPAKFEQSFPDLVPIDRKSFGSGWILKDTYSFPFEGTGIAVYSCLENEWDSKSDYVYDVEVDIDGIKEVAKLPFNFRIRKNELLAKYLLSEGKHLLKLTLLNPNKMSNVVLKDIIVYTDKSNKKVINDYK